MRGIGVFSAGQRMGRALGLRLSLSQKLVGAFLLVVAITVVTLLLAFGEAFTRTNTVVWVNDALSIPQMIPGRGGIPVPVVRTPAAVNVAAGTFPEATAPEGAARTGTPQGETPQDGAPPDGAAPGGSDTVQDRVRALQTQIVDRLREVEQKRAELQALQGVPERFWVPSSLPVDASQPLVMVFPPRVIRPESPPLAGEDRVQPPPSSAPGSPGFPPDSGGAVPTPIRTPSPIPTRIPTPTWTAATGEAPYQVLSAWNSLTIEPILMPLLTGTLVATLVASLVGLWLSWRLLQPIRALQRATRLVASGNYDLLLPVEGRDELAQLAASFNTMAGSLRETEQRRRRLVNDVAHELRTPLSAIRGYVEALRTGCRPPNSGGISSTPPCCGRWRLWLA